jgi:hypothetical protein
MPPPTFSHRHRSSFTTVLFVTPQQHDVNTKIIERFLISRKNRKMIVACIKRVCGRVAWTWTLDPILGTLFADQVQSPEVQSQEVQSQSRGTSKGTAYSCSTVSVGYKGEHRLFIAVFKRTTKEFVSLGLVINKLS